MQAFDVHDIQAEFAKLFAGAQQEMFKADVRKIIR